MDQNQKSTSNEIIIDRGQYGTVDFIHQVRYKIREVFGIKLLSFTLKGLSEELEREGFTVLKSFSNSSQRRDMYHIIKRDTTESNTDKAWIPAINETVRFRNKLFTVMSINFGKCTLQEFIFGRKGPITDIDVSKLRRF